MSDKGKKQNQKKTMAKGSWHDGLKEETKYSIWAIVFFCVAGFLTLAVFGKAGTVGIYLYSLLGFLFGKTLFLAPVIFAVIGVSLLFSARPKILASNLIGGFLVFLSVLALSEILFEGRTGGYIGFFVSLPFLKLVDFWASLFIFLTVFIIGALIMFNIPLLFFRQRYKQQSLFPEEARKISESLKESLEDIKEKEENKADSPENSKGEKKDAEEDEIVKKERVKNFSSKFAGQKFEPPPLDLLEGDKGKPSTGDIKANANIIKRTLQNFGINVEMNEVCIGPSVTQYTLKPAEGVKLSKITGLNNDLALALAAHPIRIEAPIPGKSLVGIEVPNRFASLVGLRHLLGEDEFQKSEDSLMITLGRNVAGKPVYASISKMPHLLLAGATGSGKSVAIHSLIMSLLFRHSPWDLQFLMIDPKRVELTIYNNLPYLLTPVIIEAKKAIMALKWVTNEMERRYDVLLQVGARDINSYRQKPAEDPMPFIMVVIDELADIMATYPREFEASIVRLAQMSRAVGIHLIVSTQRPSVEVITGLIKANITSRIAFQVASQVDSRTILDMAGAEKLLGNGDMLYMASDTSKPRRIQGAFVAEKEVKRVVQYILERYEDVDLEDFKLGNGEAEQVSMFDGDADIDNMEDDELYEEARELVIKAGKASTSYLQRRLRIGYGRAARILDMLQERGVIGPPDGSRPREVFVKDSEQNEFQS